MKKTSFTTKSSTHLKDIIQNQSKTQISSYLNINLILQNCSVDFQLQRPCSLKRLHDQLKNRAKQHSKNQVIGFEVYPPNFDFDYRLNQQIGFFEEQYFEGQSLCFKCLERNNQQIQTNPTDEQQSMNSQLMNKVGKYRLRNYKLCKALSSGGFSRVYLVRCLSTGQFYAAKFMEKSESVNQGRAQNIKNQFLIHKAITHPYVVYMHQYIQTDNFFILIMQYCPGGQLFNLLKKNRSMPEHNARALFAQTVLAVGYLHSCNIVFRDIKPQNILIDCQGKAKLTDFGLAKVIREKTNSYCGSVEYMAPEIVMKLPYSFSVDLYCLGALLYEMLVGCPPFYSPDFSQDETKYHICNSEVVFPTRVNLSSQVIDLILKLITKNPKRRLQSTKAIFQHPWFNQFDLEAYQNGQPLCPYVPDLSVQHFQRNQGDSYTSFTRKINKQFQALKNSLVSSYLFGGKNKFRLHQKANTKTNMRSKSLNITYSKMNCQGYVCQKDFFKGSTKKNELLKHKRYKSQFGTDKIPKLSPYQQENQENKYSIYKNNHESNHKTRSVPKFKQSACFKSFSNGHLTPNQQLQKTKQKFWKNNHGHYKSISSHCSFKPSAYGNSNSQFSTLKNRKNSTNAEGWITNSKETATNSKIRVGNQKKILRCSFSNKSLDKFNRDQKENCRNIKESKRIGSKEALEQKYILEKGIGKNTKDNQRAVLKKQRGKGNHRYIFSQLPLSFTVQNKDSKH